MFSRISCCLCLLISSTCFGIESAALLYGNGLLSMKPEQIDRIKNSKVDIIIVQLMLGNTSDDQIRKLKEIAYGKKLLIQLWWGPGGRYNWSYHSLTGLAYEPEVREDFFAETDRIINGVGPERIYGVFLLEECGFFGVDIDVPGDWKKNKYHISDGREDGNPYNNNRPDQPAWSPERLNIKRYNETFKKETGLDMKKSPVWGDEEKFVFRRWCERTAALAEIEFFKHVRAKFPKIKTFTWYAPAYPNYMTSNFNLYKGWLDGAITDPYYMVNFNYQVYRAYKTIMPEIELVIVIYGGYLKKDIKARHLANAWLGGADTICFFEGLPDMKFGVEKKEDIGFADQYRKEWGESMEWQSPGVWDLNRELLSAMKPLKAFNKHASILLVSGNWDCNWQASSKYYSGLTFFDTVPPDFVHMVELEKYSMLIAQQCPFSDYREYQAKYRVTGPGLDIAMVKDYLDKGGILVIVDKNVPDFLKTSLEPESGNSTQVKKNLNGLELLLDQKTFRIKDPKVAAYSEGYLIPYGKGLIWFTGFLIGNQPFQMPYFQNYEKFMTDSLRGLLIKQGKGEVAEFSLAREGSSYNYRRGSSGNNEGVCQFYLQYFKPTEFIIKGKGVFTGKVNPEFGVDSTGMILEK
jgi:hypothetical protein